MTYIAIYRLWQCLSYCHLLSQWYWPFITCSLFTVCGWKTTGPRFNIKMSSYQYRKSHCGDKTVVGSSYLHNGISYTGKKTSLYWFSPLNVSWWYLRQYVSLTFCKTFHEFIFQYRRRFLKLYCQDNFILPFVGRAFYFWSRIIVEFLPPYKSKMCVTWTF